MYNSPLTLKELKKVINSKTNSAPGEDALSYAIFKHLPDRPLEVVLDLFNNIWSSGDIPKRFKHAIVVPLLKPQKEPQKPESYRPIALTDHIGKILESMINNRLNYILEEKKIISQEQSGFRNKRQCLDQLARLVSEVNKCRKQNKQTAAIFLDLEKAYDQLWRGGVLEELKKAGISGQLFNYVRDFLQDRSFQVRVDDVLSDTYTQDNGVPQGSVISPTIFNLVLNRVTKSISNRYKQIDLGNYADDTALWVKANSAPRRLFHNKKKKNSILACRRVTLTLEPIVNQLTSKLESTGFKVNVTKTKFMLFDTNHKGKIKINGENITSSDTIDYLGMTIDKKLTFKQHIKKLKMRGEKALRVLSYMSGKSWGLKAKHRKLLYLCFVLPKCTYGEEIFSQAPNSYLKELDIIQCKALRIISNNLKKTNIDILHVINQVDPLTIRRLKKQINLLTRFKRNKNNPAGNIYSKVSPAFSQKFNSIGYNKKNFIDMTLKHMEINNLSGDMIAFYPKPIPLWTLEEISVDISLANVIDKKAQTKNK